MTLVLLISLRFFFFNDTATTEIYTLSLHDALPICQQHGNAGGAQLGGDLRVTRPDARTRVDDQDDDSGLPHRLPGLHLHSADRKSTRLNSSHANISYAVFCLKKKKNRKNTKCKVNN